jgi:hypothetical protein
MDLKLTNNDLNIANGDLAICDNNKEALAQAIKIRLKTLKGEWFLDSNLGMPYLTEIFARKVSNNYVRHLIISEIENIPSIKSVNNFSMELTKERQAIIKFNVILNDQNFILFSENIVI